MADRPILFSAPMIRALLAGTKTQTRRLLKPQPTINSAGLLVWERKGWWVQGKPSDVGLAQRINPGDRLWVRENWQGLTFGDYRPTKHEPCEVRYAATDPCADLDAEARGYTWRPSIFMPRFASRLTLTVTDVRVERLQNISEVDAIAEGIDAYDGIDADCSGYLNYANNPEDGYWLPPKASYASLWDNINGAGAWESNPWVAAYRFSVHHGNIDQIAQVAA